MKKKSLITMFVVASLVVSTFGATVVMADEEDNAAAEQAAAEAAAAEAAAAEQAAAEQAAAEAAAAEAAAAEAAAAEAAAAEAAAAEQAAAEAAAQAAANRTLVSTNTVYDCDGSGNGYYEYIYSDGSVEYEEFYASSSSGSSGGSSDSYYEESSYEETYYEESSNEESAAEESSDKAAEAAEEIPELIFDGEEWTIDQIAEIPDVVSGVEDKEFTAGSASKYDIHMGVDFDSDIVRGVLFRTCDVDCSTPGEYDMTYLVYFNREALLDYMEENDIDADDFPGLDDDSSDRVGIAVNGKVVID